MSYVLKPLILQKARLPPTPYNWKSMLSYSTISEQSMVLRSITDQNDPTNATAGRLLFRKKKCSPDSEPVANW